MPVSRLSARQRTGGAQCALPLIGGTSMRSVCGATSSWTPTATQPTVVSRSHIRGNHRVRQSTKPDSATLSARTSASEPDAPEMRARAFDTEIIVVDEEEFVRRQHGPFPPNRDPNSGRVVCRQHQYLRKDRHTVYRVTCGARLFGRGARLVVHVHAGTGEARSPTPRTVDLRGREIASGEQPIQAYGSCFGTLMSDNSTSPAFSYR